MGARVCIRHSVQHYDIITHCSLTQHQCTTAHAHTFMHAHSPIHTIIISQGQKYSYTSIILTGKSVKLTLNIIFWRLSTIYDVVGPF